MDKELLFAFIRTIIALPVVVGLAYVVIKYGLARRGLAQGVPGGRRMRVVEQLPLGAKGLLHLVEVGNRYYLLAQSENGFTMIKELDRLPEPLEDIDDTGGLPDFRQLLNAKLKKHRDTTEGEQGREK